MIGGSLSITVALADETVRDLRVLGEPAQVLTRLALSAADGVRGPGRPLRERTDGSLRLERDKSDLVLELERAAVEAAADEVVRIARQRADRVVETAREGVEPERQNASTTDARERARALLDHERSSADAVLEAERATGKRDRTDTLTKERGETDKDLSGERALLDSLIVDQREANERLLVATLEADAAKARAEESANKLRQVTELQREANERLLVATLEADAAKARAEESANTLRQVAEFREQFIAILGHDLRTPLGSIATSAELLLRRGALDERDAATVSRIIRSGERITRMVTQLLDLTRARLGGGLPIEPRPTDLREVCRIVVEEFAADLRLEVEGDVTGAWDPDRLAEALSNLVGNAVAYGAPGTVVVRARAEAGGAVVEVTNQGEPIPASMLPFLFEPFRRAKRASPASGNLGLGLYIAKQIVLSHGGTLDVRSADGTTTFVMRLPHGTTPSTR